MAVLKRVMQSDRSGHTCNASFLKTLPSMESAETHVNVSKKHLLKPSDLSDNWNNLMKFWKTPSHPNIEVHRNTFSIVKMVKI